MDVMTNTIYNYQYSLGDLIVVRVSAHNANGWGLASTPNTVGVTAKTVPAAMTSINRGLDTTET